MKLLFLNLENFFLIPGKLLPRRPGQEALNFFQQPLKSQQKSRAIAKTLIHLDADVVLLCEMGGAPSLEILARDYLNGAYRPYHIQGNSERSIELAVLVKHSLEKNFTVNYQSYRERQLNFRYPHLGPNAPLEKFSRDVAQLSLTRLDSTTPELVCFLCHLKSGLDTQNIDPQGKLRRKAELQGLTEIYLEAEKRFEGKVPLIVAGDFNGNASRRETDEEFVDLYEKTKLEDFLELQGVDPTLRSTYWGPPLLALPEVPTHRQLDYFFLSPACQKFFIPEKSYVARFLDPQGKEYPLPQDERQRRSLPSDHLPLVLELSLG